MEIANINDVVTLESMLKYSNSRGQKQRIKKKIDRLNGVVTEKPTIHNQSDDAGADAGAPKKQSAKERVSNIMKKRE